MNHFLFLTETDMDAWSLALIEQSFYFSQKRTQIWNKEHGVGAYNCQIKCYLVTEMECVPE